jgi:predicted N-acetyltransferase YhbS
MDFTTGFAGREGAIADLVAASFAASEGAAEGALIGDLARNLIAGTAERDLFVFTADERGEILGAIIFSRLTYDGDDRTVFVLGPVAVATGRQGQGIGQKLLAHGLAALRAAGVDVAVTYGDPAYYGKVGFRPITQSFAAAPMPLTQPHGWLAQSLTGAALTPLKGRASCVAALNDPAFW